MTRITRLPRLSRRGARAGAAAGAILAAAALSMGVLTSSASASTGVVLVGGGGNEAFTCAAATHGVLGYDWPIHAVDNGCANRVWLHGTNSNGAFSWCATSNKDTAVPNAYEFPSNAQVSANTASC